MYKIVFTLKNTFFLTNTYKYIQIYTTFLKLGIGVDYEHQILKNFKIRNDGSDMLHTKMQN